MKCHSDVGGGYSQHEERSRRQFGSRTALLLSPPFYSLLLPFCLSLPGFIYFAISETDYCSSFRPGLRVSRRSICVTFSPTRTRALSKPFLLLILPSFPDGLKKTIASHYERPALTFVMQVRGAWSQQTRGFESNRPTYTSFPSPVLLFCSLSR